MIGWWTGFPYLTTFLIYAHSMFGNTKIIDESVPAAEATVCTMLFSWIEEP